jgi:hypothetical protein
MKFIPPFIMVFGLFDKTIKKKIEKKKNIKSAPLITPIYNKLSKF